jgi:hypothetical protein
MMNIKPSSVKDVASIPTAHHLVGWMSGNIQSE